MPNPTESPAPLPKSPDPVNAPADRYESFLSSSVFISAEAMADPRPMGAVSTFTLYVLRAGGAGDRRQAAGGAGGRQRFRPVKFFRPVK